MPNCLGCGASIDCGNDSPFSYSLTGVPGPPFVEDCPPGFNCNNALQIALNCCGGTILASRPAGATAQQLSDIFQNLIAACNQLNASCPEPPIHPLTPVVMYAALGSCSVECSSGVVISYTSPVETVSAISQLDAQRSANITACREVALKQTQLCQQGNDMPLDQAVYVPATGSHPEFIAGVRGGYVVQHSTARFRATTTCFFTP